MATDFSMDFLDVYTNISFRFVLRHANSHFLFVPSVNTAAILTNKILNHPFATGSCVPKITH